MKSVEKLKDKILKGYVVTKNDILGIMDAPLEELKISANEIRVFFCGNKIDLCSIINGKSGACPEDCKYCAQSSHYSTEIDTYSLLDKDTFLRDAKNNEEIGIGRYSIVTSGKRLGVRDIADVCEVYRYIGKNSRIKLCASHGLLSREDLKKLKEAGVVRYHNNLETSRSYFSRICTTHTYDKKIQTIKEAQEEGLEVCSGGLFGLGESMEDRIDMAFELRSLGIKSVPINVLIAIKGTPLEGQVPLQEDEVLRTIALYRMILPDAFIRLAGGRILLEREGYNAFLAGANATITGNLLTTCGNTVADDMDMFQKLGMEV